jgi:hypothetical protein
VKNTTTMAELFAGSSGMEMANQAMPLQYPLHDALVEGAVEGFCSTIVCKLAENMIFFVTN